MKLDGTWLLGVWKHKEYQDWGKEICCIQDMQECQMPTLDGTVPGNYEIDLERCGRIEDPFFGKNLLLTQERELDHLFYARELEGEFDPARTYLLKWEGIDTVADIYLNGEQIGHTDNMLMEHVMEIPGEKLQGHNELLVHILPVTLEARKYDNSMFQYAQKYNMDALSVRKSNYMFGWDIFPRIMSGGIWKSVWLYEKPEYEFLQSYLFTQKITEGQDGTAPKAELDFFYEVELGDEPYQGFEVEIHGICGASEFSVCDDVWSKAGHIRFTVEDPILWWPRRSGTPALYEVEVCLKKGDQICACRKFRFGIRTIRLEKSSLTDAAGSGEFCFWVNGRRTFILGTNWVPLDSLPSRGKERIEPALRMVTDLNCNMIRCWGGGYYEDELFYEKCDEAGILVWQDMMQACGAYPERREFLERYEREVTFQVRRLRQHACVALWSGDNENDSGYGWWSDFRLNPGDNLNTRQIVPQVIRMNDYIREYLPSSPYMDETAYQSKTGETYLPEQHLWGPRDYFKGDFYRNALAHFASETGYHGCPNVESIRKFISEEALWPPEHNGEWLLHASSPTMKENEIYAYRIALMTDQIRVLFGTVPEELESYALLSQISQAEAKKYFIERFRIGKWRRTGIIWWNLLDGCPQFSDAIVDYYFGKKLAYDYIKRSQQMTALMCDEPKGGRIALMGVNDHRENQHIRYHVTDLVTDTVCLEGTTELPGDSTVCIAQLPAGERKEFYLLEWQIGDTWYRNHYVTWEAPFDQGLYCRCMEKLKNR